MSANKKNSYRPEFLSLEQRELLTSGMTGALMAAANEHALVSQASSNTAGHAAAPRLESGSATQAAPAGWFVAAQAYPMQVAAGRPFRAVVAAFEYSNPRVSPNYFRALIRWGDGSMTWGAVGQNAAGVYYVVSSHTYARTGNYAMSVQILDGANKYVVPSNWVSVVPYRAGMMTGNGNQTLADVAQRLTSVQGSSGSVSSNAGLLAGTHAAQELQSQGTQPTDLHTNTAVPPQNTQPAGQSFGGHGTGHDGFFVAVGQGTTSIRDLSVVQL